MHPMAVLLTLFVFMASVLYTFYYLALPNIQQSFLIRGLLKDEKSKYSDQSVLRNGYLDGSDCERAINDAGYASEMGKKRVIFNGELHNHNMDCESIFQRWRGIVKNASKEEREFPIAFSRAVYRDYFLQEMVLHLSYTPQNSYCFVLDKKSSNDFRKKMRQLAICYHNVFVPHKEFDMDSAGHDMVAAQLHCMKTLIRSRDFKYITLLQNHDIPIKSNLEMVRILKTLNGSNDVDSFLGYEGRLPRNIDWSLKSLKLFKNASKNDDRKLNFTKGSLQVSLSRKFVEYLFNELDVSVLLHRLSDRKSYGLDEMFFPTLNMDELGAPGGFTIRCGSKETGAITRYSVWELSGCGSQRLRHYNCIFGIEDLRNMSQSKQLFANKLLPEFDYSALSCWAQYLHNISHFLIQRNIDLSFYARLPRVRFQKERERWRKNLTSFTC